MNFSLLVFFCLFLVIAVSFTFAAVPEYPSEILSSYTEAELKWLNDEESANDIPEYGDISLPQAVNTALNMALDDNEDSNHKIIKKSNEDRNQQQHSTDVSSDMYVDKQSPSLFVMFYAPWCQHCAAIKPVFRNASAAVGLSSLSPANVGIRVTKDKQRVAAPFTRRGSSFALVDATTNKLAANTFSVRSYPTFAYFMPVLSWNDKGEALPRMVGLPYGSGRDAGSMEFVGRYLDLGLRRGFVAVAKTTRDILSLRKVEPPRVLFIVGPAANSTTNWVKVAPPGFVAASLTNGKAHFASFAEIEQIASSKNKVKLPVELSSATASNAEKNLFYNLVDAYNKASKGPGGEYVICMTDIDENNGAIPFTGAWPEKSTPHKLRSSAEGAAIENENNKEGGDQPEEADAKKAEQDEDTIAKLSAEAGMTNLYLGNIALSPAVRWIQQHSFLPIEQINAATFQQIAQEARYVALAVTKGTLPGRSAQEVAAENNAATATLLRYLQRRRARLHLDLIEEENKKQQQQQESEDENNQEASPTTADAATATATPAKKGGKKAKKTSSSLSDMLSGSTALPFGKTNNKMFLCVIDGGLFVDFLGELKVTNTIPTFVIYDTEESSVFSNPELINTHIDLAAAWNHLPQEGNSDSNVDDEEATLRAVQVATAIELFITRAENGEIIDMPVSMMGRVARFMTDYIPFLGSIRSYMNWDQTQMVAVVGGVLFSVLVMFLAGRPVEDNSSSSSGEKKKISLKDLTPEQRKAYEKYLQQKKLKQQQQQQQSAKNNKKSTQDEEQQEDEEEEEEEQKPQETKKKESKKTK